MEFLCTLQCIRKDITVPHSKGHNAKRVRILDPDNYHDCTVHFPELNLRRKVAKAEKGDRRLAYCTR